MVLKMSLLRPESLVIYQSVMQLSHKSSIPVLLNGHKLMALERVVLLSLGIRISRQASRESTVTMG